MQYKENRAHEYIHREKTQSLARTILLQTLFALSLLLQGGPVTPDKVQIRKIEQINPEEPEQESAPTMETIIDNAIAIAATKDYQKIIQDPFLMSLCYYSDAFYAKLDSSSSLGNTILKSIKKDVDINELRTFIFQKIAKDREEGGKELRAQTEYVQPLDTFEFGKGKNHKDALDLFTQEGSLIHSISNGTVILAERGRDVNYQFSTSSYKGGNAVIIYDFKEKRLYRYVHLQEVSVLPGQQILGGEVIGKIGHTGQNANKEGHGNHLHLEIHTYDQGNKIMKSWSSKKIEKRLKTIIQ